MDKNLRVFHVCSHPQMASKAHARQFLQPELQKCCFFSCSWKDGCLKDFILPYWQLIPKEMKVVFKESFYQWGPSGPLNRKVFGRPHHTACSLWISLLQHYQSYKYWNFLEDFDVCNEVTLVCIKTDAKAILMEGFDEGRLVWFDLMTYQPLLVI